MIADMLVDLSRGLFCPAQVGFAEDKVKLGVQAARPVHGFARRSCTQRMRSARVQVAGVGRTRGVGARFGHKPR